jgi:hypothetical protein
MDSGNHTRNSKTTTQGQAKGSETIVEMHQKDNQLTLHTITDPPHKNKTKKRKK